MASKNPNSKWPFPASEGGGTGGFSSLISGCSAPRKPHDSLEGVSPLAEKDPLKKEGAVEGGATRPKTAIPPSLVTVTVRGLKLGIRSVCYDPGEPAIYNPIESAHPGRGPSISYGEIYIMRDGETFPIDITPILSGMVLDSVEEKLLSQYEG